MNNELIEQFSATIKKISYGMDSIDSDLSQSKSLIYDEYGTCDKEILSRINELRAKTFEAKKLCYKLGGNLDEILYGK